MKILFLVYHGFSEHSGISKKIHYQVKGLRENGHDVHLCYYDFDERNYQLVGRRRHNKYMLGDPIRIKVAKANIEKRQLDFTIVD